MRRHFSFAAALLSTLLIINPLAGAESGRTTTTRASANRPTVGATSVASRVSTETRVTVDPITGEMHEVGQAGGSGGGGGGPATSSPPAEPAPVMWPYDFFDELDGGNSILNSYFLSQLSMGVYDTALNEADFHANLAARFAPQGISADNIEVRMHHPTGTELAVFTIGQATVIAFRGTSGEGTTNPTVDQEIDLLDVPLQVKVNNKLCRIHKGFWTSTDAVYEWVLARALAAHFNGQKIFLTGHSLGAAKATVTAFRLLYDDGIPVQGLQTFGSPKVGDGDFRRMCSDAGADGIKLAEVTQRWVVLGDPATTFPHKEAIGVNVLGPIWVYYEHVGRTHNILPLDGGDDFDISLDSGEIFFVPLPGQWQSFLTGAGDSEHMWYDDALLMEIVTDGSFDWIADLLLQHEAVEQP